MMKRWRASSLVLVVVIMAGIIVVVFGASRLTLVQYNQSNRDEDNISALYAAKAGIEDGLLRFRHHRDAETVETKIHRYNLTTGSSAGEVAADLKSAYEPTDQYYDMKLNFRGGQIGVFDSYGGADPANNPTTVQDDILELTGFPNSPEQYYLRYRFEFVACNDPLSANRLVQIQQVSQTTNIQGPTTYDQTTVVHPSTGSVVDSSVLGENIFIRTSSGQDKSLTNSIRLRPYGCSIKYAIATSLSDGGNGQGNDAGPKFDGFKSIITSTGYFGQAKRTLSAEIDRLSGRLIGIYDFNAYSGTGSVKPN